MIANSASNLERIESDENEIAFENRMHQLAHLAGLVAEVAKDLPDPGAVDSLQQLLNPAPPGRDHEAQRARLVVLALQCGSHEKGDATQQAEAALAIVADDPALARIGTQQWQGALDAWQGAGFHHGLRKRRPGQRGGPDCCEIVAGLLLASGAAGGTPRSVALHVLRSLFGESK